MLKFSSPRSAQTLVLILVAIGLVLLALGGYLTPATRLLLIPFVSVQTWVSTRYQAIQDFITTPNDVATLRQRNAELESEVGRLRTQVIALQQQVADNQVLTTLLRFVQDNPENQYVTAAVIGRDPSPFLHYVIINRGSDQGLRRGMPVVTQDGLVGRIAAVDSAAARVQLITDAASSINIRLQKSGAEAMLVGQVAGTVAPADDPPGGQDRGRRCGRHLWPGRRLSSQLADRPGHRRSQARLRYFPDRLRPTVGRFSPA